LGIVVGGRAASRGEAPRAPATDTAPLPAVSAQIPLQSNTFARIAEAIKPAVININTISRGGALGRTPFEEFFGEEFFKRFFGELPERIPQRSLGSGVVVDPSGIALTNAHVIEGATSIGIISAKARQIGQGPFDDFLQTDAAINPGNSGGPLVNLAGEVIGINTAIVAGGTGIGFAIPSNMARRIYGELLAKGRVTRGWLGVSIQPLTPELARSFGAKDSRGVLVSDVMRDSPAAKAGLQTGDILLEFDGKKLEGPGDLQRAVGLAPPGTTARTRVWRDRGEKTLDLKIGDAPDER